MAGLYDSILAVLLLSIHVEANAVEIASFSLTDLDVSRWEQ
jgi:hypothetical protein